MSLRKYKQKRDFSQTPEPDEDALHFVIQRHAARRLHYDLRLEVGGVLKSWAVPKEPLLDPSVKRLAIKVEDHPLSYKDFEGVIPSGYGAGTVEIWDQGYYSVDETDAEETQRLMRKGLKEGRLHFTLKGERLRGDFALVRLKDREKEEWIFFKTKKETGAKAGPKFTHTEKIYWPQDGITKGDMLAYYHKISPYILPYLKGKPQSLRRFPEGIEGPSFFQKNLVHAPAWVKKVAIQHRDKIVNYLLIEDERSLLFAANLGCIEIHPFFSRYQTLDYPDFLVFDLDPENIAFEKVLETALVLHEILEGLKVPNYCKTSGSRGLHVCVPLKAKYPYEVAKHFAKLIALLAHQRIPKITSLTRSPKNRQRKVYIDYLQNNLGQTLAAPYSLRAKPLAPVSTPVTWREVAQGFVPQDFTIFTLPERVRTQGELFKPLLTKSTDLSKVLKKQQSL